MSTRTIISLLIALAFLPTVGTVAAQDAPVDISPYRECAGGGSGVSIHGPDGEILCSPTVGVPPTSLTVSFHTGDLVGEGGPGSTCETDDDTDSSITVTIPPSEPQVDLHPESLPGTHCIMVTSPDGPAAVPVPSAPLASVTIGFSDGYFQPGETVVDGGCIGGAPVALTIDNQGPHPGADSLGPDAKCAEVTVTLEGVGEVLRVAAGIPVPPTLPFQLPPVGTDGATPVEATYVIVDTDGTAGLSESSDAVIRFKDGNGQPAALNSGAIRCASVHNVGDEDVLLPPTGCALPAPVRFLGPTGTPVPPESFAWSTIHVDVDGDGTQDADEPFVRLLRDGSPVAIGGQPNQVMIGVGGEVVTIPDDVLPALPPGTLGYHAEYNFTPPLAAGAFAFDSNNLVKVQATLFDGAGLPKSFAGASGCRASLIGTALGPDESAPSLELATCGTLSSADGGTNNVATFFLNRATLALNVQPGTVWLLRVESPQEPIPADLPLSEVYPYAFAYYSAPAQAAFAASPALADALDVLATPVLAAPKPDASIIVNTAFPSAHEAGTTGRFIVSLTPRESVPTEVAFQVPETALGAAKRGTDYDLRYTSDGPIPGAVIAGNSFTVPPSGSVQIEVVPKPDSLLEYNQTVQVVLMKSDKASVSQAAASATMTIEDLQKPTLTLSGSDLAASEEGADRGVVRFSRSAPGEANVKVPALPVIFNLAGSTTSDGDFAQVCISPRTVPAVLVPGTAIGGNVVVLPTGETVVVPAQTVPPVQRPAEADAAPDLTGDCLRSAAAQCPDRVAADCGTGLSTVTTALLDPTAVSCSHTAVQCTFDLAAGANAVDLVFVPHDDTDLEELTETLRVTALSTAKYTLGTSSSLVSLLDNDLRPRIDLTLSNPSGLTVGAARTNEGGNALHLTLSREPLRDDMSDVDDAIEEQTPLGFGELVTESTLGPVLPEVRVPLIASGEGLLGSDFEIRAMRGSGVEVNPISGGVTVHMPEGVESVTVIVAGLQDIEPESLESARLQLGPGLFEAGPKNAVAFTIGDDDPLPLVTLRAVDNEAGEADSDAASFLVERFGSLAGDLVVNLEQVAGGAQEGQDYTLSANQVTLTGAVTSAVVTLTPIDDEVAEAPEGVALALVDDGTFLLAESSVAGVRISDDDLVAVHVSVPDADLSEQDATTGVVRIHRTPVGLDKALTVGYAVRGSATSGQDFVALPGAATIPAGASFVDVTVKAVDDALADANEQITLELRSSTLYVRELRIAATLTILDNDLPPAGDLDGDGLSNANDICPNHADPEPADLDADGKGDACDDDQDGDGATDVAELAAGTDARDADTDRDLVPDGKEVADGSDPLDAFSPDYRAKDVEAFLEDDGMHVTWTASDPRVGRFLVWRLSEPELVADIDAGNATEYEIVDGDFPGGRHTYRVQAVLDGQAATGYEAGSSGASAPVFASLCTAQPLDSDGDDLCDARELELGTDPDVPDSDGDGLGDGAETLGRYGDATDPLEVDTDGDGTDDGDEVDLESVSSDPAGADLDAAWIGIAAVLAGVVLVLSLVGVVRFMRRS